MTITTQRVGAYLGYVWVALFLIGFWAVADFVPPPAPSKDAAQIAAIFAEHTTRIRIGMLICMLDAALLLPWCAAMACQIKRIEGLRSTPLAYIQLMAGACMILELIFPCAVWQTAAFRPDASAESIQRLNDLAWLPFLGILSTAVINGFAIGAAILMDTRERPAFPRWAGWFNVWVVTMFFPAGLIFFFKHGPFAWNGLFAWWLALIGFSVWILVDTHVLIRAVAHEAAEPANPDRDFDRLAAEFDRFRARYQDAS